MRLSIFLLGNIKAILICLYYFMYEQLTVSLSATLYKVIVCWILICVDKMIEIIVSFASCQIFHFELYKNCVQISYLCRIE